MTIRPGVVARTAGVGVLRLPEVSGAVADVAGGDRDMEAEEEEPEAGLLLFGVLILVIFHDVFACTLCKF